jgi:ASC-1-like (ASCH) protein
MPIITKVAHDKQLTIHTATGAPSFEEGMEVFKSFYEKHPTKNLLWDLRSASLHRLSSKDLEAFVDYAKRHSEVRAGGKTAFVVSTDLEFGMLRMVDVFSEFAKIPFNILTFHSMDEAMQWFEEEE